MIRLVKHLPTLGIGVFLLLYIYSANLYPGGSVVNSQTPGYDWFHNYWCDLMYTQSLNGESNTARPSAVLGWVILCISILSILLKLISRLYPASKIKKGLQVCAILGMSFGLLASTNNHDLYVALSFPFGAIVVMSLAVSAQRINSTFLKTSAYLVVVSLTSSFIMFFTSLGLYWIGFIQKIALALSFIWIIVYYYHFENSHKAN